MAKETGGPEKRFLEDFGNIVRWNGPFGVRVVSRRTNAGVLYLTFLIETIGARAQEDRLWIADPKAVNHTLQKSGYLYAKPSEVQEQSALFNDHGIASVEGRFPTKTDPSLLLAHPTILQARYTSARRGQWLRPSVSLRLKVCYHIS